MKIRIILGSCMLLGLAGLFAWDHYSQHRVLVSALAVLIGFAGWVELSRITGVAQRERGGSLGLFLVGCAGTLYFLALGWAEGDAALRGGGPLHPALLPGGVAGSILAAFAAVLYASDYAQALRALLATLLGVLLFGFLFAYVIRVYHHDRGLLVGVFFLLGAKGNDIVAYFSGRAFGRHRFLKVSPKKTLEGCASAVVFSVGWFVAAGGLWPDVFFGWSHSVPLGIIFSVTTQMGDLSESLLKRAYGVKDSAALLPEFGGVLDLIDSTLFSAFLLWCALSL